MSTADSKTTDSDATSLLQEFKLIGFTEYEAKVYMQLLRSSPATAYEIAKQCGVPRPNAYNALESLAKRGAVQPISASPLRYVAAPPDEHMASIGQRTVEVCEDLAEKLRQLKPTNDDPYVWNVHGEAAIHDKIAELIDGSRTIIWAKAADDVLREHTKALRAAAERGVDILIVLFGADADEFRFSDRCRVYLHESNGVRMGSADNLFTISIDHEQTVTAATDSKTAFYTRNRAVVQMADTLIRHDYYMAEIHRRFGDQIEEEFGKHLKQLRLSTFTQEQIRSFREKTGLDRDDLGYSSSEGGTAERVA